MSIDVGDWRKDADKPDVGVAATPAPVPWKRLIQGAVLVVGIDRECIGARTHRAAHARRLVSYIATRDLGCSYSTTARRLGMTAGAVFNLVRRTSKEALLDVERLRTYLRVSADALNDETE